MPQGFFGEEVSRTAQHVSLLMSAQIHDLPRWQLVGGNEGHHIGEPAPVRHLVRGAEDGVVANPRVSPLIDTDSVVPEVAGILPVMFAVVAAYHQPVVSVPVIACVL